MTLHLDSVQLQNASRSFEPYDIRTDAEGEVEAEVLPGKHVDPDHSLPHDGRDVHSRVKASSSGSQAQAHSTRRRAV